LPLRQNYQGGRNHEEALHTHHPDGAGPDSGTVCQRCRCRAGFHGSPRPGVFSSWPDDLDSYLLAHTTVSEGARSLPIDRSEVNEHAITGYYTYTFQDGDAAGRTFKLYAGRHAALRAYITVIAVPNGTGDTYEFLEEQGWLEQADTYGELLFVLEPANGSWKAPEEESAYLKACLGESIGNTAFDSRSTSPGGIIQNGRVPVSDGPSCPVFTGHSCNS